jgi:hypothetical protein
MTDFRFSLSLGCFVAFLSAELEIIATGENCNVSFSFFQFDDESSYRGALDSASSRRFHDRVVAALRTYGADPSWEQAGFDGTNYRGSFQSAELSVAEFKFWSPETGTPAHSLACAAIEVIPPGHPDHFLEHGIRQVREDLRHD